MVVILADYFGQQIRVSCADNEVDDLIKHRDLPGSFQQALSCNANGDHAGKREPHFQRVGDGDNLHHLVVYQVGDPLPHAGFRDAKFRRQLGEGTASIELERINDALVYLIYRAFSRVIVLIHSALIVTSYGFGCNNLSAFFLLIRTGWYNNEE